MKALFRDGILIKTQVTAMAPKRRKNYKGAHTLRVCESAMTCYFRHLTQVFEKAGIEVTSQNRQEIDSCMETGENSRFGRRSGFRFEIKRSVEKPQENGFELTVEYGIQLRE